MVLNPGLFFGRYVDVLSVRLCVCSCLVGPSVRVLMSGRSVVCMLTLDMLLPSGPELQSAAVEGRAYAAGELYQELFAQRTRAPTRMHGLPKQRRRATSHNVWRTCTTLTLSICVSREWVSTLHKASPCHANRCSRWDHFCTLESGAAQTASYASGGAL